VVKLGSLNAFNRKLQYNEIESQPEAQQLFWTSSILDVYEEIAGFLEA